ncbi:MAG: cupredoxin domain-containing protein [Actinomycetota bacterium]
MRSVLVSAAFSVFVLAACGGSSGGTDHHATCKPAGTRLHVEAQGFKFDTDCLAAPADEAFTIELDNHDSGVPHNVDIMTSADGDTVFKGDVIDGVKTVTYHVKAMKPGTYRFRCDVHPSTMQGTFIVS